MSTFLLNSLFFIQLSWLAIFAGVLRAYSPNEIKNKFFYLLPIVLTLVQVILSGILISNMICGHLENACTQAIGYILIYLLSQKIAKYRIFRSYSLKSILKTIVAALVFLCIWQIVLLSSYPSMEWIALFFGGHLLIFSASLIYRIVLKFKNASLDRIKKANFLLTISCYFIYCIVASFLSAVAFDCGF